MDGSGFVNAVGWPACRVLAFSQAILLLSAPTHHQNEMASWDRVQRANMIKKFRWPKMEQDETRPLRLPKEARDYFATPE